MKLVELNCNELKMSEKWDASVRIYIPWMPHDFTKYLLRMQPNMIRDSCLWSSHPKRLSGLGRRKSNQFFNFWGPTWQLVPRPLRTRLQNDGVSCSQANWKYLCFGYPSLLTSWNAWLASWPADNQDRTDIAGMARPAAEPLRVWRDVRLPWWLWWNKGCQVFHSTVLVGDCGLAAVTALSSQEKWEWPQTFCHHTVSRGTCESMWKHRMASHLLGTFWKLQHRSRQARRCWSQTVNAEGWTGWIAMTHTLTYTIQQVSASRMPVARILTDIGWKVKRFSFQLSRIFSWGVLPAALAEPWPPASLNVIEI